MDERTTEIRISIAEAKEAMEFYLNEYLLRHKGTVLSVKWDSKDSQFSIVLRSSPPDEAAITQDRDRVLIPSCATD